MFIPVLFHKISFEGITSTRVYKHCFDKQLDAGIYCKLYSPNSFPLLQMTPLILPTVSVAAEKNVLGYVVVLLANNGCAIDRTGSSRNSNRVND